MGTDFVEFGAGELLIVGGDYGQIVIEGTTPEARRACDAIVATVRCDSDRARVVTFKVECDDATLVLADRHAGLAGTPAGGVQLDLVENGEQRATAADAADRSSASDQ